VRARPSFARVMHLNSQSSSVRVLKSQKGLSLASRYPLNKFTSKSIVVSPAAASSCTFSLMYLLKLIMFESSNDLMYCPKVAKLLRATAALLRVFLYVEIAF